MRSSCLAGVCVPFSKSLEKNRFWSKWVRFCGLLRSFMRWNCCFFSHINFNNQFIVFFSSLVILNQSRNPTSFVLFLFFSMIVSFSLSIWIHPSTVCTFEMSCCVARRSKSRISFLSPKTPWSPLNVDGTHKNYTFSIHRSQNRHNLFKCTYVCVCAWIW